MTHLFIQKLSTSFRVVFTLFLILFYATANANDIKVKIAQDVERFIAQDVLYKVGTDTNINVRKLDPRLKVPSCKNEYEFEAINYENNVNNFSVKVTCPSINWFTFVNVTVSQMQSVVVANSVLSPGELLSIKDMKVTDIERNRLRGSTFEHPEHIQGARLKRRVREGTIITSQMLCFVCKGDRVTVTASAQGLMIKTSGIAMEDGNLGDSIKIENISTDKKIIARVVSSGEVQVRI